MYEKRLLFERKNEWLYSEMIAGTICCWWVISKCINLLDEKFDTDNLFVIGSAPDSLPAVDHTRDRAITHIGDHDECSVEIDRGECDDCCEISNE
jgi:hypothetical protein